MALQANPLINTLTFLVVDDSVIMRRLIKRTLRDLGVKHIVEAGSTHMAWKALDDGGVDFILCDWNMPGETGIDFLGRVRQNPAYCAMPFLMVSAESKTENIMLAIQNGVSNYLTKPFTPEILARKILAILDQTRPHIESTSCATDTPSNTAS